MRIAVFSGPTATIQNTPPLVTSDAVRAIHGLPRRGETGFDLLRAQRLAAPATVYIEAFSAHPLESDSAELHHRPDGYLDDAGTFHENPAGPADVPVYVVTLNPEDGLYLLPYPARRRDGGPWEADSDPADSATARQTFYPDAARLFEEIDRFGIGADGSNNLLRSKADFDFVRAAPSAGYRRGLPAENRSDLGSGDISPERAGRDYFGYGAPGLATSPTVHTLAGLTNIVQRTLRSGAYDGAIWLEGSGHIEETIYWLGLVIDAPVPICANAAQRAHGTLSADGDRNVVGSVNYISSRVWADSSGRDAIGAVLVQDDVVLGARDAHKLDARPGAYAGTVLATAATSDVPHLTARPAYRHAHTSAVAFGQLPAVVPGLVRRRAGVRNIPVTIKDKEGMLCPAAMPVVRVVTHVRYGMEEGADHPAQEVEIFARLEHNLSHHPLSGFVLAGNSPYGHTDEAQYAALIRARNLGVPVVRVGRGTPGGPVPRNATNLMIAGSDLSATKARMLLIACLLRYGCATPAAEPDQPTAAELARLDEHFQLYQAVFDSH